MEYLASLVCCHFPRSHGDGPGGRSEITVDRVYYCLYGETPSIRLLDYTRYGDNYHSGSGLMSHDCILPGIVISVALFFLISSKKPPHWTMQIVLGVMAFVMSIAWLNIEANEVVAVLDAFGLCFGIDTGVRFILSSLLLSLSPLDYFLPLFLYLSPSLIFYITYFLQSSLFLLSPTHMQVSLV